MCVRVDRLQWPTMAMARCVAVVRWVSRLSESPIEYLLDFVSAHTREF